MACRCSGLLDVLCVRCDPGRFPSVVLAMAQDSARPEASVAKAAVTVPGDAPLSMSLPVAVYVLRPATYNAPPNDAGSAGRFVHIAF